MKLKVLLARWKAARIENATRAQRRALRDYTRREGVRILDQETRSRGLRLYAAWSVHRPGNVVSTTAAEWHTALQHAA